MQKLNLILKRRSKSGSLLFILLVSFVLVGCNESKGYRTQSGLIFYVFDQNSEDSTVQIGHVLKLNIQKFVNDSLVESTYDGVPEYEKVMPGVFSPYEAGEIFQFLHKGDSVVMIQEADSLLTRRLFIQVPSYVSKGDIITTHLKILDVFTNDSLANMDMNNEYPLAIERNRLNGAARMKQYLDEHGIDAELTPDTVFIETIEEGDGEPVQAGDVINIRFRAETLSGRIFGDNTDSESAPMHYEVMTGVMPIGIEESLLRCRVGDHVRFYLPAMKAFGASPPPGGEKGFQDMIFEVKILGIGD